MPGESGATRRQDHYLKESRFLRQRRRKMRLGEFQLLALLGKGAFGSVYLVSVRAGRCAVRCVTGAGRQARKRDTGEVVAVKKISKEQFDASNKDRVIREKKVLETASDNPWLVGLSYAFQASGARTRRGRGLTRAAGQGVSLPGHGVRARRRRARAAHQHRLSRRGHGGVLSRGDDRSGERPMRCAHIADG